MLKRLHQVLIVKRYLLPAIHHPARRLESLTGVAIPYWAATGIYPVGLAGRLINQDRASFCHIPRVFSASLHVSYLQFFLGEVYVIKQSVLDLRVQSKFLIQILNALVHSLSNLGPGLSPLE